MRKAAKFLAGTLAAALVCASCGCGSQSEGRAAESGVADNSTALTYSADDSLVWTAEYAELSEGTSLDGAVFDGDFIYTVTEQFDENSNQTGTDYARINLSDGTTEELFAVAPPQAPEDPSVQNWRNVYAQAICPDGRIVTVENFYTYNRETEENSSTYYLCRYSASGEQEYEIDITEAVSREEYPDVRQLMLDGEDRICVALRDALLLYDADGKALGQIEIGGNGEADALAQGADGSLYAAWTAQGGSTAQLQKVNFEQQKLDETYGNFPSGANAVTALSDTILLVSTDSSVLQYDLTAQTSETLFDWLEVNIGGSYVQAISVLADGSLAAVIDNWDEGEAQLAFLSQTAAVEGDQKEEIVLAAMHDNTEAYRALEDAVISFNQSSDRYHVKLKAYIEDSNSSTEEDQENAYTRMNSELVSSDCPDMLLLDNSGLGYVPDTQMLAAKGAFADLTPYLENSEALERSDFVEAALNAYIYGEELVGIPQNFTLRTIAAKTADVGEEPGWTLSELMDYADAHPDALLFGYESKTSVLRNLFAYSYGDFIDWETGSCSFDQESFIRLLEFTNRFPESTDYSTITDSTPTRLSTGKQLLSTQYIYQASEVQFAEAEFGESVTFIGYPNAEGTSGTYLMSSGAIAILEKSEHKDGAWAFLESWLTTEKWYDTGFGFPVRTEIFERLLAESMTPYIYDVKGNVAGETGSGETDENGNILTGQSTEENDGWSYTYHVVTEEEIETLRELIDSAQAYNECDTDLWLIVFEEAGSYFSGDKTAEEAAKLIQSRATIYIQEKL